MLRRNVLVVDDEHLIRSSLAMVLCDRRTEVVCAMSGEEALRELRSRSFDLCFFDIHLPDMNGLDLMKAAEGQSPAAKVVMMTGGTVDDDAMAAIQKRAVFLLAKPFNLFQVKELAEDIMEKQIDTYRDSRRLIIARAEEKRLHARQPFTNRVRYAVVAEDSDGVSAQHFADTVNISLQGLGIRTDALLDRGRVIRLRSDREDLRCLVRWSEQDGKSGLYRVGLQFLQREA